MKKILATLILVTVQGALFAQTRDIETTPFTRNFLHAPDAQTAASILGGVGTNGLNGVQVTNVFSGLMLASNYIPATTGTVYGTNILPGADGVSRAHMTGTNDFLGFGNADFCNIFLQSAHSEDGEMQIASGGRIALLPGYDQRHLSALQFGDAQFAGSPQGDASPFYFTGDYFPTNLNDLGGLGYSHLHYEEVPFYTNSQNQINAIGNRAHALDTNGTLAQTFYNLIGTEQGIGYIFLHGALPGTVSGFEIFGAYSGYGNGVAIHGRETRDILESSPGTNFGVDWETARDSWLDISQNINFTNVPQTWARANNEDERIINVNVGLANITASFPSNWLWSGALPTNMLNQNVYKIRVERVVANSTNYLADCSLIYTNHFNFDTNALAYINNSGLTNLTQEAAINTFTLAAKNHGYFANLIAFYPVLGGNTNTAAYDLVTSTNRGKFYGTSTVTTSGMASDGTSGYFNSFIVPSNVFAGFGTASFGMAISSTNACAYNDFAGCDNGSTYLFGLGNTVIATNYFSFSGPESFSTSTGFPTSSSTNFMGVMALMQNSTVNCVGWVNDALGNGGPSAVTSTILPALPVYFEANNHNNGLQYPSKAVENSIFFANYMTTNSMSLLIGDIQNMNSTLGR